MSDQVWHKLLLNFVVLYPAGTEKHNCFSIISGISFEVVKDHVANQTQGTYMSLITLEAFTSLGPAVKEGMQLTVLGPALVRHNHRAASGSNVMSNSIRENLRQTLNALLLENERLEEKVDSLEKQISNLIGDCNAK